LTPPRARARPTPALPPPPPVRPASYLAAAAVALAAAILYTLTAARDIVVGDTGDFIAAALMLGVAHAPGYPLLTMIGHALSWLPIGPDPFRVNVIAVLSHAGAVGVTCLTMMRLTRNRVASALAALLLATVPLIWRWSLAAEAFPLNNLFVSIVIYCLVRWQEAPERTAFLVAAAFACGLALSNHMTIVLLGPAILFVVWTHRAVLFARPPLVALCLGAVLIGLVPYAYIPWAASRHPYLNTGGVSSLAGLFSLVTRADYGSRQLVAEAANAGGTFDERVLALLRSFTIVEGLLILAGAVAAYRRQRAYLWFAAITFALAGLGFMAYANLDLSQPFGLFVLERFFMLSHVVLAPLMAPGVVLAIDFAARRASRPIAVAGVSLAVAAAAATSVVTHYRAIDQRTNHVARTYAEDILSSLPPHAILLGSGDDVVFSVTYLQAVEHVRMDVTPVWTSALRGPRWYRDWLRARDPQLVLPPEGGDPRSPDHSMKVFADANGARPIAFIGPALDDSVNGSYVGIPRGLVVALQPASAPIYLDTLVRENEQVMASYRVPAAAAIKPGTFETGILRRYAIPAQILGSQLERAGHLAEAKTWYERAAAIDPTFADPRDALARIGR
jgi:hypothetical protein